MTTPPTPDAGRINEPRVITALHLLRDLGFTALYDAEERPAASIADILDAWDTLTAQLAAAKADGERLDYLADEPVFDGFADCPLDVYELESIVAEQNGRVDPNASDRREAFRRLIDAARTGAR